MPTSDPDGEFLRDVLAGLAAPRKSLPCKYFYDAAGSELFEQICRLPEYYPTRCELAILRAHAAEITGRLQPGGALIEYGSGSSLKTRLLLDGGRIGCYVPVDVSRNYLHTAATALRRDYPGLDVLPVVADFSRPFALPASLEESRPRAVYFSGSTIGNFGPPAAVRLLRGIAGLVGPGGGLIIAVDLKKDRRTVEAAYNDRRGVTARFNLNLLARLNRELGGDFVLERFRHRAVWNEGAGRIEMYLDSLATQTVHVGGHAFSLAEGEPIHTEDSYKFSRDDFARLAREAGMKVEQVWTDDAGLFSVQFARVGGAEDRARGIS